MFTNDFKHLDNPIYQPFDAIFLSVNVVFDSNYWPYSQILISCLPTNCGMSLDTYISGSKLFVRYYIRGECREGDNCRFSHDSKDVPVSIT